MKIPLRINGVVFHLAPDEKKKQAGAELGQPQYKLELDFTSIFCRIGFSQFCLVELVSLIYFAGLIEKIWCGIFGSVYIWFFTFQTFCLVDLILLIHDFASLKEF